MICYIIITSVLIIIIYIIIIIIIRLISIASKSIDTSSNAYSIYVPIYNIAAVVDCSLQTFM